MLTIEGRSVWTLRGIRRWGIIPNNQVSVLSLQLLEGVIAETSRGSIAAGIFTENLKGQ